MAKKQRPTKLRVGDEVRVEWDDIVTYPRISNTPDAELQPAEFRSWGVVVAINARNIVLYHEQEVTPEDAAVLQGGSNRLREPTVIPCGAITRITVFKPSGEAALS